MPYLVANMCYESNLSFIQLKKKTSVFKMIKFYTVFLMAQNVRIQLEYR